MDKTKSPPTIITASDVANMLGVCTETVYRLARKNEIPCKHIGTKVIFTKERILEWIDSE